MLRLRAAGLLDLARIEEMHRSADIRLSEKVLALLGAEGAGRAVSGRPA